MVIHRAGGRHLFVSLQAVAGLTACAIDKTPRGKEKPSDHTPVWIELTE
jgi:exodeoxyribonuclease-3